MATSLFLDKYNLALLAGLFYLLNVIASLPLPVR